MRLVGGASIPAAAVLTTREIADDGTFARRSIRQTMAHPVAGNYVMTGWPVRFGDAPPPVGPAPLLGQHSAEVLVDWLGIDADAIDALRRGKVIADTRAAPALAGADGRSASTPARTVDPMITCTSTRARPIPNIGPGC